MVTQTKHACNLPSDILLLENVYATLCIDDKVRMSIPVIGKAQLVAPQPRIDYERQVQIEQIAASDVTVSQNDWPTTLLLTIPCCLAAKCARAQSGDSARGT